MRKKMKSILCMVFLLTMLMNTFSYADDEKDDDFIRLNSVGTVISNNH